MIICPEKIEDYKAIYNVNILAFKRDAESKLVNALRKSSDFIVDLSLVALIDDEIVGYALFTPIIIESENNSFSALALGPLAVLPQFQRRSIGSKLVNHGLYMSKKLKFSIIVVIGNPDYYKRFGFVSAHKNGIKTPFKVPDQVFMVKENIYGALKGVKGIVRYPQDFLDLI